MIRSLTRSEQEAVEVLLILMQEKIIPPESWQVMEVTPIKITEKLQGRDSTRREIKFCSLFYEVEMTLIGMRSSGEPLEGKGISWNLIEAKIKTRPLTNYPWKTQYLDLEQFREMRICSFNFNKWQAEVAKNYEKFEIRSTGIRSRT